MKARKFWKHVLTIRYLVALLIVIALGIFGILYFAVGLEANAIEVDNIKFDTEGFENFANKEADKINTAKKVGETDKYIMFINEDTTVVSVAVKSSLKAGENPNDPKSYAIKYDSANTKEGSPVAQYANFNLTYSSNDLSKPVTKTLDSYSQSVKFSNVLTGGDEKHYSIRYNEAEKSVQVYYTIGQFSSIASYFPAQLYSTLYKPARCIFETDEDYNKAVEEYENGYLAVVGNINNTYEERFRGNVQIYSTYKKNLAEKRYEVSYANQITVFTQEALDYLLDVVFPELEADGIAVPSYDKEELYDQAKNYADKNKNYTKVEWTLKDIPVELLDCDGEYYNKYFNVEGSPLTNNPFLLNVHYVQLPNSYAMIKADGSTVKYAYYKAGINPGPQAAMLYDYLYNTKQTTQKEGKEVWGFVKEVDGEYVPFTSSGYVARDEEGNPVRDEEGKLVRQLYNVDQVSFDNNLFAIETEGIAVFKVALEFKLTNDGLVVSVIRDSLVDSTNVNQKLDKDSEEDKAEYNMINGRYIITDIKICPYMTNVDNTQDGYIIVPDGSGAIINFNNGKTGTVSADYYGNDKAYVKAVAVEESAQLLLGMFAFVNTTKENPGGLLAVIEKGGGQVSLTAGVSTQFNENYANITANLRGRETVRTGTVADSSPYDKFDKIFCPSDIVVNYLILGADEIDYSSVAKKYQDYLIKRDGLTFEDKSDSLLTDLTFLGTFEKYSLLMGIKYLTSDTLTTFEQAEEIMNELYDNKVDNISVSYKGWNDENLEYELGGKLKVANVLGNAKSMQSFYKYCVEKGATFYPELNVTTAKGYDYLFGSTRFTARGVGNEESIHYVYDLATGRPNKKLKKTYYLSPLYYKNATEELLEDFKGLNIWSTEENGGFYLTDLGNRWAGNYREGRQVYGADAILYQQQVLEMLADGSKIKIEKPCDYAFKYVDMATGVPVSSAMYTVYDQTIPFYQLVVNGLFDYTTETINGTSSRSSSYFFAKILETGSNVNYMISAEDPAILLETDYTQYFQAYYNNWKDTIINFAKEINEIGIHKCYLSKHEVVSSDNGNAALSKVTYTNKTNPSEQIVLIVNVTEVATQYNGQEIAGYGYYKVK